jgi:protein-disulfide isomerase
MQDQRQSLSIPVAIIIAGALIAFGIYMTGSKSAAVTQNPQQQLPENTIAAPTAADHILGNAKAPIVIVEYSDIECPFCKQDHSTLHLLLNEYEKSGKVAWVYRHFPVHENSAKEAEATECAAELGGNDAFWRYLDKIFEMTPSNDGLDLAKLPEIAQSIGLNVGSFNTCLSSGKHASKIEAHFQDMKENAVRGTPYAAIFAKGELVHEVREGAVPHEYLKAIVDDILKSI